LAPWIAARPGGGALEAALAAALAAARAADEKLSRNGATAAHRLCQCEELAAAVAGCEAGLQWVAGLLVLYRERGGLRRRAGGCSCFLVLGWRAGAQWGLLWLRAAAGTAVLSNIQPASLHGPSQIAV
jgi:hypothetical protein